MNRFLTILVIFAAFASPHVYAGNRTDVAAPVETKKSTKHEKVKKTDTAKQKKLPPCEEFLKDWGGRGGFSAWTEDGRFAGIAPAGCSMVLVGGLFVPECEENGKMVRQCKGGVKP